MKQSTLVGAVVVVVCALMLSTAFAHKYQKREAMQGRAAGASGEAMTSMSDCMSFCASFSCTGGMKKARANFDRQFGNGPVKEEGRVLTYAYDDYTNVILDCSGRCYCKCLTR